VSTPLGLSRQSTFGRRLFIAALVLLFVILGVRYGDKAVDERSAFSRWRSQLLQLGEVNISEAFNYPNPPIMAVLLEPLARLPPLAGAMLWFFIKAALALLSLYWVFRLIESTEVPFPPWARAVVALLSLKPIVDDLIHGNINLFILFLVVAALTAYRRRRDGLAGVVLALAIACKVTPALFIPYFVWKRSWRLLAGCAVGLLLFLWPGVVPALRLGWQGNQQQLHSWYRGMVHPFVVEGKVTSEHINQSLPGLVYRLTTPSPSFVVFPNNVETPRRYDNLLDLTPTQAKWLVQGCMGLFALAVVCCCRTSTQQRHGWPLAAEFALVVLGMLLFSERTWKHHCVTLMLPFAVLVYYLARGRPSAWLRGGLVGSLVVVTALMLVTGLAGGGGNRAQIAADPGLAKLALVYGAYTAAWVVLVVDLLLILRLHGSSSPSGDSAASEAGVKAA
jgi:hypothetical protein